MKTKLLLAMLGLILVGAGCVGTVSGRKTGGVPFVKDSVIGAYERPVQEVFQAAVEVVQFNGKLINEATLHLDDTNSVKTVEGKINERKVWIRVEPHTPTITTVEVQARGKMGGTDLDLVHEIEKQIALKLK